MTTISLEDAREIAKSLGELSSDLEEYRISNGDTLSDEERGKIKSLEWTLLNYSSDMTANAIEIATASVQDHVSHIMSATQGLENAISKTDNIRKVIGVVTKTVTLAASIASGNVVAIKDAADGLIEELS